MISYYIFLRPNLFYFHFNPKLFCIYLLWCYYGDFLTYLYNSLSLSHIVVFSPQILLYLQLRLVSVNISLYALIYFNIYSAPSFFPNMLLLILFYYLSFFFYLVKNDRFYVCSLLIFFLLSSLIISCILENFK